MEDVPGTPSDDAPLSKDENERLDDLVYDLKSDLSEQNKFKEAFGVSYDKVHDLEPAKKREALEKFRPIVE